MRHVLSTLAAFLLVMASLDFAASTLIGYKHIADSRRFAQNLDISTISAKASDQYLVASFANDQRAVIRYMPKETLMHPGWDTPS